MLRRITGTWQRYTALGGIASRPSFRSGAGTNGCACFFRCVGNVLALSQGALRENYSIVKLKPPENSLLIRDDVADLFKE
jgi:hypothetical protein